MFRPDRFGATPLTCPQPTNKKAEASWYDLREGQGSKEAAQRYAQQSWRSIVKLKRQDSSHGNSDETNGVYSGRSAGYLTTFAQLLAVGRRSGSSGNARWRAGG